MEEKGFSIKTDVNAKTQPLPDEKAWQLIADANKVYVASGSKIIEFDPATADKTAMLKLITGRSGNLRAPSLKLGNDFYIGYNTEMYEQIK